jgi:molybdopterin molybdotransferase
MEKVMSKVNVSENANSRPEIEECREKLLAKIKPQQAVENIQLSECVGRVTAEDIYAGMNVPPFPKSAMDGYAVRSSDIHGASKESPITLKVAGELLAGDYEEIPYEAGTAVRVMTGSFIPEGYDAVIRQEDTDYGMDTVEIYSYIKEYTNYCKIGEDIEEGECVLQKGTRIFPGHVALLASLGIVEVPVYKKARIAIISTGTELFEAGGSLKPGKIYNSIAYMLSASIRSEKLDVVIMETCSDDEAALEEKINHAVKNADFVITTGGVSVGKKDIVPLVLKRMGAEQLFKGAAIQPGTPTMASVLNEKIVLSLSGNPYAAMANFEIYFWPAMAAFMKNLTFDTKVADAVLKSEYNKVNRMRRLIRAYADNGEVIIPSNVHSSSVIHNLTKCNCFILLEAGRSVKVGDVVKIIYFKNFMTVQD